MFVAGGIGITPVISVLRTFADAGDRRPLTLVYASRTWDDATFREELDELSCALDLQVVHVLSRAHDGWAGERGRVDAELLARVLPAGSRERTFLVCGPPAMTDAAVEAIERLGVPPARVHAERFASV